MGINIFLAVLNAPARDRDRLFVFINRNQKNDLLTGENSAVIPIKTNLGVDDVLA